MLTTNRARTGSLRLMLLLVVAIVALGCSATLAATPSDTAPATETADDATPDHTAMASSALLPVGLSPMPDDLAIVPAALRPAVVQTAESDEEGDEANDPGILTVRVVGLRSSDGVVRVAIYDSAKGFPKDRSSVVDSARVKISGGSAETSFDLEPGRYAVAILHDENENGSMDYNGLGMPSEGFGASLNKTSKLGPPSWDDSSFELGDHKVISIETVYF